MTVCYRGIPYQKPDFALDTHEEPIKGRYRGENWHHRYPNPIPESHGKPNLTYRGVLIACERTSPSTVATACPLLKPEIQKIVTHELGQTHIENMRRSIAKRLHVAKERGDKSLISLLEQEFDQLTII